MSKWFYWKATHTPLFCVPEEKDQVEGISPAKKGLQLLSYNNTSLPAIQIYVINTIEIEIVSWMKLNRPLLLCTIRISLQDYCRFSRQERNLHFTSYIVGFGIRDYRVFFYKEHPSYTGFVSVGQYSWREFFVVYNSLPIFWPSDSKVKSIFATGIRLYIKPSYNLYLYI